MLLLKKFHYTGICKMARLNIQMRNEFTDLHERDFKMKSISNGHLTF